MKTYIINNCEIITDVNNVVSFARNLLTGKFIKHSFASNLLKYASGEGTYKADNELYGDDDSVVLDFVLCAVAVAVCFTIVLFLSHLSVAENAIILLMLVALRMLNVANVNVRNLTNKKWSV